MRSVVKVSKTIDDAVEEALIELGVERDDVELEILEEPSRGIFGLIGVRDAVVRATVTFNPAEIIDIFLTKTLSSMGVSGMNIIDIRKDVISVDIKDVNPKDMGIIIGRRGATLDAIQYLLSLVVNKGRDNYTRIVIDINDYRKKREMTLEKLAGRMAHRAKKSKRVVKLEPMNPYERRIIHSSLQNDREIVTYSEGKDPYRRVVIKLKD